LLGLFLEVKMPAGTRSIFNPLVKMSPSQVANLLQRRKAGDQLINRWKGLLDENI